MSRKKYYLPLQLAFTCTGTTDVVNYQFYNRVKINYIALRQLPTNSFINIWSDESGQSLSNLSGVKGIAVRNAVILSGGFSSIAVFNCVTLNATNTQIFFKKPWVVRNLYCRSNTIGAVLINLSYYPFE